MFGCPKAGEIPTISKIYLFSRIIIEYILQEEPVYSRHAHYIVMSQQGSFLLTWTKWSWRFEYLYIRSKISNNTKTKDETNESWFSWIFARYLVFIIVSHAHQAVWNMLLLFKISIVYERQRFCSQHFAQCSVQWIRIQKVSILL